MARRPRRQYRRKGGLRGRRYYPGNLDENLSVGALASGALISDTWDEAVVEKSRISSIDAVWWVDNIDPGLSFLFGVAHSDYTDAEIEEVIEISGSWDPGNKISQERAKRQVRIIGVMSHSDSSSTADTTHFNQGRKLKTKLNWALMTGDTLKMWAYNRSAGALTNVPVLKCSGKANLWLT